MIIFLPEKVILCTQMYVDCLRASKLVTLGYTCVFVSWSRISWM